MNTCIVIHPETFSFNSFYGLFWTRVLSNSAVLTLVGKNEFNQTCDVTGTGDLVLGNGTDTSRVWYGDLRDNFRSDLDYTGDMTIKTLATFEMGTLDTSLDGDLYLETGATFDGGDDGEGTTGDLTVNTLYINNLAQAAGTYTSSDLPDYISSGTIVSQVPEPASLALLGLGGLTILARRRHA